MITSGPIDFDAPVNDIDTRCLLWPDFLVAPLLEIHPTDESGGKSQYQEIRFSGNDTIAKNDKTPLGLVVDSYIHHTLVDSFGEFLVADVQGADNYSWIQKTPH